MSRTAVINTRSIISSMASGASTKLTYDMGFQDSATSKEITFTGTIEAINKTNGENIKYAISLVDQTNKKFVVPGNQTALFINALSITVAGSTGNNGTYTVSGASTFGGAFTYITVVEAIPNATADGYITV